MSEKILSIAQIIVSVFLIFFILLQQRGGALGSIFGEGGFYTKRRGVEKKIFWATIIFGILFIILAILKLRF
jgi:preprotein translocase subunit SecG